MRRNSNSTSSNKASRKDRHGNYVEQIYDILLSEYLPRGTTINSSYYASIMERLHCAILEKCAGKVVLLLHSNAAVHKCNIAIRKTDFVELNHPVYSPGIASSDYYLLSNLNKFLRGENFSPNDERIDIVETV